MEAAAEAPSSLEADDIEIASGAWVTANGGGGGAGQASDYGFTVGVPAGGAASDGATTGETPAPGGVGKAGGGNGGAGAAGSTCAVDGQPGGNVNPARLGGRRWRRRRGQDSTPRENVRRAPELEPDVVEQLRLARGAIENVRPRCAVVDVGPQQAAVA